MSEESLCRLYEVGRRRQDDEEAGEEDDDDEDEDEDLDADDDDDDDDDDEDDDSVSSGGDDQDGDGEGEGHIRCAMKKIKLEVELVLSFLLSKQCIIHVHSLTCFLLEEILAPPVLDIYNTALYTIPTNIYTIPDYFVWQYKMKCFHVERESAKHSFSIKTLNIM